MLEAGGRGQRLRLGRARSREVARERIVHLLQNPDDLTGPVAAECGGE